LRDRLNFKFTLPRWNFAAANKSKGSRDCQFSPGWLSIRLMDAGLKYFCESDSELLLASTFQPRLSQRYGQLKTEPASATMRSTPELRFNAEEQESSRQRGRQPRLALRD
jgi:hypothetical protein